MGQRLLQGAAIVAVAIASGCTGFIFIEQPVPVQPCEVNLDCTGGGVCVEGLCLIEVTPCSGACVTPDCWCPDGEECGNGVCVAEGTGGWCVGCTIDPPQGCVDGMCVDIDGNECSANNPTGLCPGGELCIGGACVPCEATCSAANPSGCCPPDSECNGGVCRPVVAYTCSTAVPMGTCPPGQACTAGNCAVAPCSPQVPLGTCPSDQICRSGVCEDLPCGPLHTNGDCPNPSTPKCSSLGNCIASDECEGSTDCGQGQKCSLAARQCIPIATCLDNVDCPNFFKCEMTACVRDFDCTGDADCVPMSEFCSAATPRQCITTGTCADDADCLMGQSCSNMPGPNGRTCLTPPQCIDASDCPTPGDLCTNNNCLPPNACFTDDDCRPGRSCNMMQQCVVPPAKICTGNIRIDDSCPMGESCCDPMNAGECCSTGQRCGEMPPECSACGGMMQPACPTDCERACILDGQCITDDDCLSPNYACVSGTCTPQTSCFDDMDCSMTERCNREGACIPLKINYPEMYDGCAADNQCASPLQACNAFWECENASCAGETAMTTLVEPNMLVIFDRSGSMQSNVGGCNTFNSTALGINGLSTSRWNVARDALAQVMIANDPNIRFGLLSYPLYCERNTNQGAITSCGGSDSYCDWPDICAAKSMTECGMQVACTWNGMACVNRDTCGSEQDSGGGSIPNCMTTPDCRAGFRCVGGECRRYQNCAIGLADVPVAAMNATPVNNALRPPNEAPNMGAAGSGPQYPGGYTPTDRALRRVLDDPAGFLLPDPMDPIARPNYVMLVTDGDANNSANDPTNYPDVCNTSASWPAMADYTGGPGNDLGGADERTNCAIDQLASLNPSVQTFAVGFAGGKPEALTCAAVFGGTSQCAAPADCTAQMTQRACESLTACYWSGGNCLGGVDATNCGDDDNTDPARPSGPFDYVCGSAVDCGTHMNMTDCGNETGCVWSGGSCQRDDQCRCYYNAGNAATLLTTFQNIAGAIASSSFVLSAEPPCNDSQYLFVYVDYGGMTGQVALPEGVPGPNGYWTYNPGTVTVEYFGQARTDIQAGAANPVVLFGCPPVGESCN